MRIIIALITLCIVAVTAITLWLTPARDVQKKQEYSSVDLTRMETYTNRDHGFSVSYHLPNEIIEHSTDSFSIGTMSGHMLFPVADLQIFTKQEGVSLDFYAMEQAINFCTLHSSEESSLCKETTKIQTVSTDSGIVGVELYVERTYPDELQESKRIGPFFAFPLRNNRVIIVSAPFTDENHTNAYSAIRVIAESLRVL